MGKLKEALADKLPSFGDHEQDQLAGPSAAYHDQPPPFAETDQNAPFADNEYFRIVLHEGNIVVPGDTITGILHLDVRKAHEQSIEYVDLAMKGKLHTMITVSHGQSSSTYHERVPLCEAQTRIWNRGGVYPQSSNTDIIELPFSFTLPRDGLYPSFHAHEAWGYGADVYYKVKAVGFRQGTFKRNRKADADFAVVIPDAIGRQIRLQTESQGGWNGSWRSFTLSNAVKEHFWSAKCDTQIIIDMPDIPVFPVNASIPVRLEIVTYSKTINRPEDLNLGPIASTSSSKGPSFIFPRPPESSKLVKLAIHQHTWYKAKRYKRNRLLKQTPFPEYSEDVNAPSVPAVGAVDTEWVPDSESGNKGKGRWKQTSRFEAVLKLPYTTETFSHEFIRVTYQFHIKIGFDGSDARIKGDLPIVVSSGV